MTARGDISPGFRYHRVYPGGAMFGNYKPHSWRPFRDFAFSLGPKGPSEKAKLRNGCLRSGL